MRYGFIKRGSVWVAAWKLLWRVVHSPMMRGVSIRGFSTLGWGSLRSLLIEAHSLRGSLGAVPSVFQPLYLFHSLFSPLPTPQPKNPRLEHRTVFILCWLGFRCLNHTVKVLIKVLSAVTFCQWFFFFLLFRTEQSIALMSASVYCYNCFAKWWFRSARCFFLSGNAFFFWYPFHAVHLLSFDSAVFLIKGSWYYLRIQAESPNWKKCCKDQPRARELAACNQENAWVCSIECDLDFLTITGNHTYILPLVLFFF